MPWWWSWEAQESPAMSAPQGYSRSRGNAIGQFICEETADVLKVSKLLIPATHGNSSHYSDAFELVWPVMACQMTVVWECFIPAHWLYLDSNGIVYHGHKPGLKRYVFGVRGEPPLETTAEMFEAAVGRNSADFIRSPWLILFNWVVKWVLLLWALRTAQQAVAEFIFKSCINTQLSGGNQEAPVSDGDTWSIAVRSESFFVTWKPNYFTFRSDENTQPGGSYSTKLSVYSCTSLASELLFTLHQ